ncbi:MAG TPA: hypothetical protein VFS60_00690 [Thermoanaerobaculia bacterium]|nr:hypothetical protein [Thermoanaerobaculia bacterium]
MHRPLTAFALVTVAALGAAAARAGEPQDKQVQQRMVIVHRAPGEHAAALPDLSQIPGDRLKVDDLASYAPGESRSYTTEGGAEVTITRAAEGERYTLRSGEKEIEIGAGGPAELALAAAGEGKRVIIRHEVKSKDGAETVEEEQTVGGPGLPDIDLLLGGDGPPPLIVEIAGEKDGKPTRQVIVLKHVENVEKN